MKNVLIKPHDQSICRWSIQENGMCPYRELTNMILNGLTKEKIRCKDKQCLQIIKKHRPEIQSDMDLLRATNHTDYTKPDGPATTMNLLSNVNIDDVLHDWSVASINSPNFTNGPFYHVDFEMRDFMRSIRSALRDLDFDKLRKSGFRTFGCVLNTDVWAGPGEHWVCIFGTIKAEGPIKVEYFNSSGNGLDMFSELVEWADHKCEEGYDVSIKEVSNVELQKSETECGMWCLCYIKSRLEGHDPLHFIKKNITDDAVTEMRRYLFHVEK